MSEGEGMQFSVRGWLLVAGLGGTLAACGALSTSAANPENGASRASQSESEVDLTSLAAFGRSNPECLAWTNWNRTCSRLNSSGDQLHCNEAVRKVRSSEIFCLSSRGERPSAAGTSVEAAASNAFNRFCTDYRTVNGRSWCFE